MDLHRSWLAAVCPSENMDVQDEIYENPAHLNISELAYRGIWVLRLLEWNIRKFWDFNERGNGVAGVTVQEEDIYQLFSVLENLGIWKIRNIILWEMRITDTCILIDSDVLNS